MVSELKRGNLVVHCMKEHVLCPRWLSFAIVVDAVVAWRPQCMSVNEVGTMFFFLLLFSSSFTISC